MPSQDVPAELENKPKFYIFITARVIETENGKVRRDLKIFIEGTLTNQSINPFNEYVFYLAPNHKAKY